MLRFQAPPDKIFMAILEKSISMMLDGIKEIKIFRKKKKEEEEEEKHQFESLLPIAGNVFNTETAMTTLKRMLICHKRSGLYYLNDYHYLLLYDTLQNFCDVHNDLVKNIMGKEQKRKMSKVGAFYIEKIDFDAIIGIYFYDTDFLIDTETMINLGLEKRKVLGIHDESFGISQGLAPHPEELKIKVEENEKAVLRIQSHFFGSSSRVYPDWDPIE